MRSDVFLQKNRVLLQANGQKPKLNGRKTILSGQKPEFNGRKTNLQIKCVNLYFLISLNLRAGPEANYLASPRSFFLYQNHSSLRIFTLQIPLQSHFPLPNVRKPNINFKNSLIF